MLLDFVIAQFETLTPMFPAYWQIERQLEVAQIIMKMIYIIL